MTQNLFSEFLYVCYFISIETSLSRAFLETLICHTDSEYGSIFFNSIENLLFDILLTTQKGLGKHVENKQGRLSDIPTWQLNLVRSSRAVKNVFYTLCEI